MNQVGDYILTNKLGKGGFGDVYLAIKKGRKEQFAIKKMYRKNIESPELFKYFKSEIQILNILHHPNIVKLEEVKKDKDYYYVVMEYINGGSLLECLKKYKKIHRKAFTEEIVQYLMKQIIDAIKYLHGNKIMHRDLKLANIMAYFDNEYDKNNLNMLKAKIKIIDFGLALKDNLGHTALGTLQYMDPIILKKFNESPAGIISRNDIYDEKVDIWSIGAMCYQMIIGKSLFECSNRDELERKMEEGNYNLPTSLSKETVSFLNGMLQYNRKDRLSANELANHPFLTKRVNYFTKIDLRSVSNKIGPRGLNMNIKNNGSIWSIFNEQDELTLSSIGPLSLSLPPGSTNFQSQNSNDLRIPSYNLDNSHIKNNFRRLNTISYSETTHSSISNMDNSSLTLNIHDNNKQILQDRNSQNNISNISNSGNQQSFHRMKSLPINYSYRGMKMDNNYSINNYQNNMPNMNPRAINYPYPNNNSYPGMNMNNNYQKNLPNSMGPINYPNPIINSYPGTNMNNSYQNNRPNNNMGAFPQTGNLNINNNLNNSGKGYRPMDNDDSEGGKDSGCFIF